MLGVRVSGSGKLVGFITAVPARVRVRAAPLAMVEINYLCVHKKLRAKRLAPVLIKARQASAQRAACMLFLGTNSAHCVCDLPWLVCIIG